MSTSLAEQLRRLAAPQTSILVDSLKRPSILFDAKEAAEKDRATLFEIGYNGLMELATLNPAFLQFEQTLFDRATISFERSVEGSEVNQQLNKTIKRFFYYLSPYFMLQPAHMCLEWLIRRYNIHQFNKNELLQLIFPYHETKMFVKCIQILRLKNTNDEWSWLLPIQRSGAPLARSAVLNQAATDPSFLKFICNSTVDAVKELDTKAYTLQVKFAFYCISAVGALEYANEVSEWHVSTLLPSILKGMSSKELDFCAAVCMIAAQLVVKTQLSTKLLKALVLKVCQVKHTRLHKGAVSLLVLIFQNQIASVETLSPVVLGKLVTHEWLPTTIDTLVKQGTIVGSFCGPLVTGCLRTIQSKKENWRQCKSFLNELLLIVHLKDNEANNLIRCILETDCATKVNCHEQEDVVIEIDSDNDDDITPDNNIRDWYLEILLQLERQYPTEFDFVLKETMRGYSNISESHHQVLKTALAFRLKSVYSEDNVGVYENLYHYNVRNRVEAVSFLVKNFDKLHILQNNAVLKDSLLDRLGDDEPKVLQEILKLRTASIISTLGAEVAASKLSEILYKRKPKSEKWTNVISKVVEHLLKKALWQGDSLHSIILAIIPFLLPVTLQEVIVTKQILSSEIAEVIPLFIKLSADIKEMESAEIICETVESHLSANDFDLLNINDLLNVFSDLRDSVSFLLLICSIYKDDTDEVLGIRTVNRILEISEKFKITSHAKDKKWYRAVRKNEIPLQLYLNSLRVVAERTKSSEKTEYNCNYVFVKVFEVLLRKSFESKPGDEKVEYTETLRSLMHKKLPSLEEKLGFLACYFIKDCAPNAEENLEIQLRAIRLFSIVADSCKSGTVLNVDSFIKILVALSSKTDLVRKCTLDVLNVLRANNLLEQKFDWLVELLIERHDEIVLDHEQFPLILFTIITGNKTDKKASNVLDELVAKVVNMETVDLVKLAVLNILKHINNAAVFRKLLATGLQTMEYANKMNDDAFVLDSSRSKILHFIITRIDQSTIKVINEEPSAWDFVQEILRCHRIKSSCECKLSSVATALLEVFDEDLYRKLSENLKHKFVDEVITALTFTNDSSLLTAGNKLMKRISLNAKHIDALLVNMKLACSSPSPAKGKQSKLLTLNAELFNGPNWKKGITLLELLQNKKKIDNFTALISPLVDILKKCLEFEEQSSFEYAKQLVLSTLLQCCQKLDTEKMALQNLQKNTFCIDLVVQCIQATQNPQTHHHALLLLAQCASMFPEQALHNIMAIFTFMGSSVVRHDDTFSFQIITRIIEAIVPTLVNMQADKGRDSRVVSILRIFSDIVLDVPEHRRLHLYTKLMRTLSAEKYLWMFICVLLEAHVVHDSKDKNQRNPHHHYAKNADELPKRVEFALQLIKDFDVKVTLETCIALFGYIYKLPTEKDGTKVVIDVNADDVMLFNVTAYNARQFRHFKYSLVQFVNNLTSSPEFINQIAGLSDEETKVLKPFYQEFIIKILCYVPQITSAMALHSETNQLQYWKVMLHNCYDVLENAISLLSPDMLLVVVQGLMQHRLLSVRKKVIEILIAKLQYNTDYFISCNEEYLTKVLFDLNSIVETILDKSPVVTNETVYIQQSALITIKLFSKCLATKHLNTFKEILVKLTRILKKHDSTPRIILASVILAVTEICSNLRVHAISHLSKFTPYIIEVLQGQSEILNEQNPDNVSIAIVTAVHKLFDTLPLFLGPYLVDILSALVGIWARLEKYKGDQRANIVVNKLTSIWAKIAAFISLRVVIPVCSKTYKKLTDEKQFAEIGYLMKLLNECFASASSEDIQHLQAGITEFYLSALNFRVENVHNISQNNLQHTEDSILQSFVSLVLKLSESSFRLLYQKVYDWAMRRNEEKNRVLTFFILSAKAAEALKSLFVLFASDIIKDAAELLEQCNSSKSETELYFAESTDKNKLLIKNILDTLHRIFLHDSKDFMSEHRFEILMQPIVDQLQNPLVFQDELLKNLLQACVSELANAVRNDALWKRLNYQILLKTRNNNPEVRILAMNSCMEIARKLGEQFIPLLPETVPFIAEMFEDEVEKVEKSCRYSVQELEKSLGISLQEYF